MRFVVASSSEKKLLEASRLLGDLPRVELKQGSVPDSGAGCDAAIFHYTLAHDRYGGRPTPGLAQVLRNTTNDGAPAIILATPPLEDGAGLGTDERSGVETHAMRMVGMALAAWAQSPEFPPNSVDAVCLLHTEGAGLTFGSPADVYRGVRRAFENYA